MIPTLRFTWRLWSRERPLVLGTALAMVAATLLDVTLPVFVGRLVTAVDRGATAPGALRAATIAVATIAALGAGAVALRQLALVCLTHFTLRMMRDLRADAFTQVQRFSTRWHADHLSGSVVRLISRGVGAVETLCDTVLLMLLPAIVVLFGAAAVLGAHWPVMGAAVAGGALLTVAGAVLLSVRWVAPAAALANIEDTRVSGLMADAVTCNAAVRAFGAERREEALLDHAQRRWRVRMGEAWRRGILSYSAQSTTQILLQVLIAGTITLLWARGRAGAGDVAQVLATFFVLDGYLNTMGQNVRMLQRAANEMEELVDLMGDATELADAPGATPLHVTAGAIAFDRVRFGHGEADHPLFHDLTLRIEGGEHVGLVGRSGSGKSSFVRLIQRLSDVQAGRIAIDGQDIAGVTQESLRRAIAIVPQEPILFHRSLAENIAYARPGAGPAAIARAARLAHADAFIERLPQGYATLVGERGVKLSGGERQRVAIARAILADAPILMLDEATASLDSESEAAIQAAMASLLHGRTALVIAHRLSTVRAMDRILVFDRGEIVEEGAPAALLTRADGAYRALHERQALGMV